MEKLYGDLDRVVGELQEVVRTSTPESVSGDEARRFVERFAEAERASASGVALFTPVVTRTGSHAKKGHASAQEWLGKVSGSSTGAAKGRLAAAERAAADPTLTDALHEGGLSLGPARARHQCGHRGARVDRGPAQAGRPGGVAPRAQRRRRSQEGRGAQPRDRAPAPGPGPHQPPPARAPGRFGGRAGRVLLRRTGMGPRGAPDRGPGQGAVEGGRWRLRAPRGLPARRPDRAAQWLGRVARPGWFVRRVGRR